MALQPARPCPLPWGGTANYFKVAGVNLDWHNRFGEIHLLAFVDAAARQVRLDQPIPAALMIVDVVIRSRNLTNARRSHSSC